MLADRTVPARPVPPASEPRAGTGERAGTTTGLAVVRAAGAPLGQRRLPRRAPASIGRRERHAFGLVPEWVPKDLALFDPVREGWLVHNLGRHPMRVETDWIRSGEALFAPGAVVMLQRGDHRLGWTGLEGELSVSVKVRTRRPDDDRIPYAVDSAVDPAAVGIGSYLGVPDAAMSAALRYRMAVLFRHLLEDEPEPSALLEVRAGFLGVPVADLEGAAHRLRRRLNVVLGTDLRSVTELGAYLVREAGAIGPGDLDP